MSKKEEYTYWLLCRGLGNSKFQLANQDQYEMVNGFIMSGEDNLILDRFIDEKGTLRMNALRINFEKYDFITTQIVKKSSLIVLNEKNLV